MLQHRPRRASAALLLCLFTAGCAFTTGKAGIAPDRTDGLVYVISEGTPEFKVTKPDPVAGGAQGVEQLAVGRPADGARAPGDRRPAVRGLDHVEQHARTRRRLGGALPETEALGR